MLARQSPAQTADGAAQVLSAAASHRTRCKADTLPFADLLIAEGYRDLCIRNGVVCGLHTFNFTTGLVVGLNESGYQRRYCYEHEHQARAALIAWNGDEHPGGPWIKCKGAGIDLLNPDLR